MRELNFIKKYKDEIEIITKIFAILSFIGFGMSAYVTNSYYAINNIQSQTLDTYAFISISLYFVFFVFLFTILTILPSIGLFFLLKEFKNKKDIKVIIIPMIIRMLIFWVIFISLAFMPTRFMIYIIIILVAVTILLIIHGFKKLYSKDKFLEKNDASILLPFDFIFPYLPILVISVILISNNQNGNSFHIMFMIIASIIFLLMPFLYILSNKPVSNIVAILIQFVFGVIVIFTLSNDLFIYRTIQILNIGGKKYNKLILSKEECDRLNQYKKLGYQCDKNYTIKNMYGVWLMGDKPIFGRVLKGQSSYFARDKLDKNSTLLWLHKDQIQSQL